MIFWEYSVDCVLVVYVFILIWHGYIIYVVRTSKRGQFKSGYFTVFSTAGVMDIINGVALEYIRFANRVGLGSRYGVLLQISAAITGSNYFVHLVCSVLMSVFQFTAIYSPMVHGKIWSSKNTSRAMAIVVLGSFAIYSHLLFTPYRFTFDDTGREIYVTRYDPIWRTRLFDSICIVSQTVVCTILVLLTTWKIKKTATTDVKKALAEKSLLLVTVINIVFGCFSFLYGLMHLTNMAPDDDNVIFQFVGKQYLVYFFLLVNLNAFILPILSGTFREELWSRWFGKRNVVFVASTKM